MKILLTGSEGFIGTHFKKLSGFKDVVCWDKRNGKDLNNITEEDLKGIDVIVHLAALIEGRHSWEDPLLYLGVNTGLTVKLVNLAVKAGVKKFVFASTAAVHGRSPYGASKRSAEHFLACYWDKIDVRILRFYNIYGPGQNPQYPGIVTIMKNQVDRDLPIEIYGSGEQVRDFVYIDDIVKALVKECKLEKQLARPRILEVGTKVGTTINQLADMVIKVSGKKVKIKHMPSTGKEIEKSVSIDDYFDEFVSLEEGINKMYEN